MTAEQMAKRNYIVMLLEGAVFHIGFSFIQADTVVASFIDFTTNSTVLIGLAVSLGTIMFLVGQFIAGMFIHRIKVQSKYMARVALFSRSVMIVMAVVMALGARGTLSAWLFLLFYSLFVLTNGMVSMFWVQVSARTLPVRMRGEVVSMQQTVSGVVGLATGTVLKRILTSSMEKYDQYTLIFGCAGIMMLCSVVFIMLMVDRPHESHPEKPVKNPVRYIGDLIPLFRKDRGARQAMYARCLYTFTLMSIPLNYKFGQINGLTTDQLSMLVYMPIAGNIIAGIIWAQMSRRKGYPFMMLMGQVIGMCCAVMNIVTFAMAAAGLPIMVPLSIAMVLVSVNGLGYTGYMQHVIAIVDEADRPSYIVLMALVSSVAALSSTFAGIMASNFGYLPVYIVMLSAAIIGIFQTYHFFISKKSPLPAEQTNNAEDRALGA